MGAVNPRQPRHDLPADVRALIGLVPANSGPDNIAAQDTRQPVRHLGQALAGLCAARSKLSAKR